MSAPSLHEIAAMPLPASIAAVRRSYDSYWRLFDFDGGVREICVDIDFEVTREDTHRFLVQARSTEEAEQFARAELKEIEGKVDVMHVRLRDPFRPDYHPALPLDLH